MQKIKRSALLPFSAEEIYRLVDDIEKYPDFLPYCRSSEILDRSADTVSAKIEVAKGNIAKSFSTENQLLPYSKIQMNLIDGPFKYLRGCWCFKTLSDSACKIELDLEFEFSNRLTSIAFSSIFNQLAEKMVSAFSERANEIYAKK